MGYPASAALLFKALSENQDEWLHREAKKVVNKFSLFAIILADPAKDPVFYEHLQSNFSFYDRLTGINFLFFSIIKEADADNFDGAYRAVRVFNETEAYRQDHAAEEFIHSELVIHAICTIVGINYDDTPCLLISNELQFGQFCCISTGLSKLEKQLLALRNVADYLSANPLSKSLTGLLKKFNEQINFFDTIERLEINKNTIRAVSKILQAVSFEGIFDNESFQTLQQQLESTLAIQEHSLAKEKITETIALLRMAGKKPRRRSPYEGRGVVNQLAIEGDQIFRNRNNTSKKLADEWNGVQSSTKNYLSAASFINDRMNNLLRDINDYSIYTLPLCKSFETEINLSVVQLMRKKMGVSMPMFFSKFCPEKGSIPVRPLEEFVPHPRDIHLNNSRLGKWIPPGLGESRLIFATLRRQSPDLATDWQSDEKLEILIQNWIIIQRVRNLTTHTDPVSRNEKAMLESSLQTLHANGLLNGLTSLKSELSH